MEKQCTVALVGNPNSGKTTMFNSLTGSDAYVGNWAGVTVERKIGKVIGSENVTIVDLPGIYSLSPYTLEEVVTRDFLTKEKPDVILNIVDASNLERNLYLTSQLLETGVPVIVALNMYDVVKKQNDTIDTQKLSILLGAQVVKTTAASGLGLKKLIETAQNICYSKSAEIFKGELLLALKNIQNLISDHHHKHYLSVKLFLRDKKVYADMHLSDEITAAIEQIIAQQEKLQQEDCESIVTAARYSFAQNVVASCYIKGSSGDTLTKKIDNILTNKYFAIPIFMSIMFLVYYISVSSVGALLTSFTKEVVFDVYVKNLANFILAKIAAPPFVYSLVLDGFINGVGAVLGFVPQLAILFLLLSILEDSGYMARVAFIMDKIFRSFSLSGKSFIPLMVSSGCGVPGIMATRTIENTRERKITMMVTTFIPCGAKLPIIALIAGSFFNASPFVAPSIYFLGIAMVAFSGILLKTMGIFAKDDSPFIMELPNYHLPLVKNIFKTVYDRIKSFVVKAGTVIFVASGLIWFFSSYDFSLNAASPQTSILAAIGGLVAPFFAPLGFGNWQSAVATITGLVAKESVVSTLSVLSSNTKELFSTAGAYSFLVFNMLCAPCVAAIGAIYREMDSIKWTFFALAYQTSLAYVVAFIIYNVMKFFI